VAIQEVSFSKVGSEPADDYTLFYENGNDIHHLQTSFFIHQAIRSAVKMVEFSSGRMSYVIL